MPTDVTFDFSKEEVRLIAGEKFNAADEIDMSGMFLLANRGTIWVYALAQDGPGERAGVHAGDRILTVDGKKAEEIGLLGVQDILKSGDGKKVQLVLERDGKKVNATVVLTKLL